MNHFEQLWEECEKLHVSLGSDKELSKDKLSMFLSLYSKIDSLDEKTVSEKNKMKEKIFGQLIFELANLSLCDNINVFKVMNECYLSTKIDNLTEKYK